MGEGHDPLLARSWVTVLLLAAGLLSTQVRLVWGVDDWPMLHHDLIHSGYSTSPTPVTQHVRWTFSTGDWVESSPAVVAGKVYVGSWDDKVYCLDAATGAKQWEFTTGGDVYSSPAVADGKVYVGSFDGKVYCLNAATGGKVWEFPTLGSVTSSPAVANGRVYVGSFDGNVYCLNATNGSKVWEYPTADSVGSSPAIANGRVYVGSDDFKVYCLDAATGARQWYYSAAMPFASSPAVAGGKVYVGCDDGMLYCLDAANGGKLWGYPTGDWVRSSPAVTGGKVYVGSDDRKVYCLDAATGAWQWEFVTGQEVWSSPAVADGKVYVGSWDGKLYCLNATSGAKQWEFVTAGAVFSSPAVADGRVYVGCDGSKIYAFLDNLPPTCNITYSPASPVRDEAVAFESHAVDSDGTVSTAVWDFGDGSMGSGLTASHAYAHAGTYAVSCTVTDDDGGTGTCTATVSVIPTGISLNHTFRGQGWVMMSVPLVPSDSAKPEDVFYIVEQGRTMRPDELAACALNRYSDSDKSYVPYDEFDPSGFGDVTPRDGYWFNYSFAPTFTLRYYGLERAGDVDFSLQYAGWNIVGYGHILHQSLASTSIVNDGQGGVSHSFGDAWYVDGWISGPMQTWDPLNLAYFTIGVDCPPFEWNASVAEPWYGYWFNSNHPNLLWRLPLPTGGPPCEP